MSELLDLADQLCEQNATKTKTKSESADSADVGLAKFATDLAAAQKPMDPEVARALSEDREALYMTYPPTAHFCDRCGYYHKPDACQYRATSIVTEGLT